MSSLLDFKRIARARAYTAHYRNEENPFGILSSVHPLHPMRKMETIRVGSLAEMQTIVPVGLTLRGQNKTREELIYILTGGNKPEIDIYASDDAQGIFPIVATVLVAEETFNTPEVGRAIIELLWRKVDAIEAIIWWYVFTGNGYYLSLPNPAESFREIFAFGRAFLMRVNPEMFFEVLMTPRSYGAMLLDNAAGANQDTSYTEHQIAAGLITPIPVAMNYRPITDGGSYNDERIVIYPLSFARACKRYIYEVEHIDKVRDATEDRNMYRVTCERYLSPIFPYDYYFEDDGRHVIPAAVLSVWDAINSIQSKYGPGAIANLDYIARVV